MPIFVKFTDGSQVDHWIEENQVTALPLAVTLW